MYTISLFLGLNNKQASYFINGRRMATLTTKKYICSHFFPCAEMLFSSLRQCFLLFCRLLNLSAGVLGEKCHTQFRSMILLAISWFLMWEEWRKESESLWLTRWIIRNYVCMARWQSHHRLYSRRLDWPVGLRTVGDHWAGRKNKTKIHTVTNEFTHENELDQVKLIE